MQSIDELEEMVILIDFLLRSQRDIAALITEDNLRKNSLIANNQSIEPPLVSNLKEYLVLLQQEEQAKEEGNGEKG